METSVHFEEYSSLNIIGIIIVLSSGGIWLWVTFMHLYHSITALCDTHVFVAVVYILYFAFWQPTPAAWTTFPLFATIQPHLSSLTGNVLTLDLGGSISQCLLAPGVELDVICVQVVADIHSTPESILQSTLMSYTSTCCYCSSLLICAARWSDHGVLLAFLGQ